MTTSQESSRKFSLEMKSEVHYKKAAKSYRKSKQYMNMINLYPTLQSTLIECKDENLIEYGIYIFSQNNQKKILVLSCDIKVFFRIKFIDYFLTHFYIIKCFRIPRFFLT